MLAYSLPNRAGWWFLPFYFRNHLPIYCSCTDILNQNLDYCENGFLKNSGEIDLTGLFAALLTARSSRAIISVNDITIFDIATIVIPTLDITESGMVQRKDIDKYLPLSESTCYIMLALVEPAHGYAIMQEVEAISEGTV